MPNRPSPNQPLVFYDTETTGTNIDFDQILQFAAILTTPDFKEIDRFEIRCRRLPWVVPSPGALLVTGMSPQLLDDPSLPLFPEMMTKIRDKLQSWSPAIFLGYNSNRFDEALLQRALWQNLYSPYLTITNGNGSVDILPLVRAVSRVAAHALKIPNAASGRPSYRLDRLAPLNGFAHKNAHDALGDVEATIHIARRIASRAINIWSAAVDRASKKFVVEIIQRSGPLFIMETDASGKPGWWGLLLGQHEIQNSKYFFIRLDQNWEQFFTLNELGRRKFLSQWPTPVRQIRINRAPMIFDSSAAQEMFGIVASKEELAAMDALHSAPQKLELVMQAYLENQPTWPKPIELEQRVFESFPTPRDERLMTKFHSVPWAERSKFIRGFDDGRLQQVAQRLIYIMAPDTLAEGERESVQDGIRHRLISKHNDTSLWRTIKLARREIKQLTKSTADQERLNEISVWLKNLSNQLD